MPRTAYFGKIYKRFNSTLQPDYSGWSEYDIVFKQGFDVDNPTIVLSNYSGDPPTWNQFYLPDTAAWYWITSCKAIANGRWEISGTMDVLATYKAAILITDCYIEYGYNQDASGAVYRLPDARQNVSQVPQIAKASADITGGKTSANGMYILSAVGASDGVATYALYASSLHKIINTINTDITDALANKESVEEILKYLTANSVYQGSAVSAIRSCYWLPFDRSIASGNHYNVYLGEFNTKVDGVRIENPLYTVKTSIAIPWQVTDWRRNNCQVLLYVPYCGTIGIPVDKCNNATTVDITWCLELLGGTVSIRVDCGGYTVYTGSASLGAPYAIGSSNVPISNFVSGSLQTVGGALQAGSGVLSGIAGALLGGGASAIAEGASQVVSGAGQMANGIVQSISPVVQCSGSMSGSASAGQSQLAELQVLYYQPIDDAGFSAVYGHPVMRMGRPVAGYCKTRGFSCAANARSYELGLISQLMDTGVFIE